MCLDSAWPRTHQGAPDILQEAVWVISSIDP